MQVGARSVVDLYTDAYLAGALGADVLDDLGRLHAEMDVADVYSFFDSAGAYIYSSGLKSQLAYMLGMLTHYLLDSRLTPYVMYLAENGAPHFYDEQRTTLTKEEIVTGVDYYVVRAYLYDDLDKVNAFSVREFVAKDIGELYESALFHAVRHAIPKDKVVSCLQKISLQEGSPVDMLNVDYANTRKREWTTVRNGNWRTDMSLEEFFEKMEPIALKLITDYMDRARSAISLNPKAFFVDFLGVLNK